MNLIKNTSTILFLYYLFIPIMLNPKNIESDTGEKNVLKTIDTNRIDPNKWNCTEIKTESTLNVSTCSLNDNKSNGNRNQMVVIKGKYDHETMKDLKPLLKVTPINGIFTIENKEGDNLKYFIFEMKEKIHHFSTGNTLDKKTRREFVKNIVEVLKVNWEVFQYYSFKQVSTFIFSDKEGKVQFFNQSRYFD